MSLQRFYIDASTSFPPPLGPKLCLHGDQDWSSTTNTTLRCHLKVDRCDSVLSEPPPDNIEPRERWEVLKRCRPSRSVWSSPQKVGRQVDHHLGPAGWRFSGPPALLPAQSQSVAADCCDVAALRPSPFKRGFDCEKRESGGGGGNYRHTRADQQTLIASRQQRRARLFSPHHRVTCQLVAFWALR